MKPVILVVEDEEDLLQILSDAIAMTFAGHEVIACNSIEQAEGRLDDLEATGSKLALIIVDHLLGGERTGLDVLEGLSGSHADAPRLLFTGRAPPEVEQRAARVGARVLWKPVRLKTLLQEVTALL